MQRHVIFIQTSWCRCRSSDSMRIHLRYVCHTQKKLASHRLLLPATFRTENSLLCCCGGMWFIHLEYLLLCFAHYLINGIIYAVYHYGWLAYPSAKDRALVKICEDGEKYKKKNITRPMQWKAVTLSALIRDEWRVSRPSCRVSMRLTGMRALVLLFACGMFLFSFGCSSCWRCAASFACWGGVRHALHCSLLVEIESNIPGVL